MRFRPPLADHPRLGALATLILALMLFRWVLPQIFGDVLPWPVAVVSSFLIASFTYAARTRSKQFLAGMLTGVSLLALAVYAILAVRIGIRDTVGERTSFAAVIAVPLAGIALAWWMVRRPPRAE